MFMNNKLNIKSILGKLMTIVVVVIATQYNVTAGVITLLVMIVFNNSIVEGMENKEDASDKKSEDANITTTESSKDDGREDNVAKGSYDDIDDISKFRNDYCIEGKLTLDGKHVTMGTIKEDFPQL